MLQFAVLTKRIKIERASERVGEGGLGCRVTGNFSSHPPSRPPSPHATADCNRSVTTLLFLHGDGASVVQEGDLWPK